MPGVIDLRDNTGKNFTMDMLRSMIQQKIQNKAKEREYAREDALYRREQTQSDRVVLNKLMQGGWTETTQEDEAGTPVMFSEGTKYFKQQEYDPSDIQMKQIGKTDQGAFWQAYDVKKKRFLGKPEYRKADETKYTPVGFSADDDLIVKGEKGLFLNKDKSPYAGGPYKALTQPSSTAMYGDSVSFGDMAPDEKEAWYEQHFLDRLARPSFGRDYESRRDFDQGFAQWFKGMGLSGADVIKARTDVKTMGKALNKMVPSYNQMKAFVSNINGQIDELTKKYEENVDRVGIRFVDVPLRALKTRFKGSGKEQVVNAFLKEISAEITKLSQNSQDSVAQLPEGNREEWERIHDPNLSLSEIMEVLDATRSMAQLRLRSYGNIIDEVRGGFSDTLPNKDEKGKGATTPERPADLTTLSDEELLRGL